MPDKETIAVVLGSGLAADGSANPVTDMRARTAAQLLRQREIKLICSGSRPPDDDGSHGLTEAQVMADIVRSEGIDGSRILIEDQSFDSFGNAIFTARRHLADKPEGILYVVTSQFHMPRALYIFSQVLGPGWQVIAYAVPDWELEHRQTGAPAAMERALAFFDGIAAGDLDACEKKLFRVIPAYVSGRAA
ncbi:MAG: YdcF family protein [Candidatus Melainabacteria bacterium]|nr:YdcF family protein [Candidatus Melainabacteria bacterium]